MMLFLFVLISKRTAAQTISEQPLQNN
ncbi:MAG: hypothetical protein ACJAS3_002230 [Roseivirga sp.]